ncbi:MAG: hypothetical protein ACI957_002661 [Verrucomicrobiales bacterium]|jgi:hypothetical protein
MLRSLSIILLVHAQTRQFFRIHKGPIGMVMNVVYRVELFVRACRTDV